SPNRACRLPAPASTSAADTERKAALRSQAAARTGGLPWAFCLGVYNAVMRMMILLAAALVAFTAERASAGVADSGPNGFTVKIAMHVGAPPAEAYRKFVRNVGDWWNPAHTFSGSAKN